MINAPHADVYSAIADPTRRGLLKRLAEEGERNVTELLEPLAISQPALSKHLRILREAGLVERHKQGRMRVYSIQAGRLRQVHDWITYFERFWDDKLDALDVYLDKKKAAKRTGRKG